MRFRSIDFFSMFYCKDIDNIFPGVNLIDNTVVTHPVRKFSFVITNKRFAFLGSLRKGFDLCQDPFKEFLVRFVERFKIRFCLSRKFYVIDHLTFNPSLNFLSATVFPFLTSLFALAIALVSSLFERISSVSISPSNSSVLIIIALSTPFLVMVKRSYFSSTSLMIAERFFFASARGRVLVTLILLLIFNFDHNYSLCKDGGQEMRILDCWFGMLIKEKIYA